LISRDLNSLSLFGTVLIKKTNPLNQLNSAEYHNGAVPLLY
jgi:hypothetical protein